MYPLERLGVEAYLAGEQRTEVKHEYLDGQIVAMGSASRAHGLLALSLSALLLPHARRKGCQLFTADMKVRIDHDSGSWFYYPDLVLACDPSDREPLYVRRPCLLVEVLSPSTEHIDTREKLLPTACCRACANTCCCARTACKPTCISVPLMAAGSTNA